MYTLGNILAHWSSETWTLTQCKCNVPELTFKTNWDNPHDVLKLFNVKLYKEIRSTKGERIIIGFFKVWKCTSGVEETVWYRPSRIPMTASKFPGSKKSKKMKGKTLSSRPSQTNGSHAGALNDSNSKNNTNKHSNRTLSRRSSNNWNTSKAEQLLSLLISLLLKV